MAAGVAVGGVRLEVYAARPAGGLAARARFAKALRADLARAAGMTTGAAVCRVVLRVDAGATAREEVSLASDHAATGDARLVNAAGVAARAAVEPIGRGGDAGASAGGLARRARERCQASAVLAARALRAGMSAAAAVGGIGRGRDTSATAEREARATTEADAALA